MGGENPYLKKQNTKAATEPFEIEFRGEAVAGQSPRILRVTPGQTPTSHTGLPGSIMDYALANSVDIDHACGGVLACSTCHVWVHAGVASCNEPSDDELDMLEKAPGLRDESRLACQCVPSGGQRLVVEIPSWNRNLVREGNSD